MTKQDLQKELKEKVKEGIKPSDLKKLKRSKSADDIPTPPNSVPLKKSQSQLETPLTQSSPKEQITQLKEQVKFHAETAANYLKSLQTSQAKVSELEEKLKETNQELDASLLARYEAVKQFSKIYDKLQGIKQELNENVDQASEESINQDEKISQYRASQKKAQTKIQELERDLQLSQRLAELRKYPFPSPENGTYLKYALYSLAAVLFTLWLVNNLKIKENQ